MSGDALLSASGLGVRYGNTQIIRDLDLTLHPGADVAVVGRSGSGKTSLLLALAGLLPPSAGNVQRSGLQRRDIGVVFQSPSLLPELSAVENVALPMRLTDEAGAQEATARAAAALADLGIHSPDALPGQLSGGQQQRVAVARVLAGRPRIVLADEPTGALDRATARIVLAALRQHRDSVDGALVVATHDPEVAATLFTTMTLDDGVLTGAAA
jgi:ABC-type lipoprotein export system ATPase subunit